MKQCPQTDTQSVYDHGLSVWKHTKKLISGNFEGFKLPQWFIDNHRYLVNNLVDIQQIKDYNIFHDCGKPYCLKYDQQGRKHFPNHEKISQETYFKMTKDQVVSDLIGLDMVLHTKTAEEIRKLNLTKKQAFTLLITAFSEIHSNAEMFGGVESTSFKIKWKKLDKRGKMLLKMFPEDSEHPYSYVIVRKDLSYAQKAVQGTHAAIEHFKNSFCNYHPSVIYVVVKNENKLKKVAEELLELGITFSIFREPDSNNEMTALCTQPLEESEQRTYLRKFMLLRE